ncbi:hypothetical protein ABZY09_30535 [Streptomyces sp. NPDC002928]|uniref:hypothetical protein n=1 Tax=Streptomyces sp. NPDC002928 TaxID=3154440 RepID=UPI0033B30040
MADSEWYDIDPGHGGPFTNFETADEAAQKEAAAGTDSVDVVRYTATTLRRYTRQVTITAEDVTSQS